MRSRLILAGSAAYLALIFGVMLWRGISIEPEWVVLALLLIAIALGRGRSFIVDWLPFLILFLAYEEMRGFAAKTGFAPHDLSGLERAVFGGAIPTLVLQHDFYHPGVVSPQDVIGMIFYFMHFPLPIVVGFYFWMNNRDHYRHLHLGAARRGQLVVSGDLDLAACVDERRLGIGVVANGDPPQTR